MPKKRIVVTSRGIKLDMDALKASQPKAVPIVTGRGKEKPVKEATQKITAPQTKRRVNATVPAPHPKNSQFIPTYVAPVAPIKPAVTAVAPTPAIVPATSIIEEIEEGEKEIKEFERTHKKEAKKG